MRSPGLVRLLPWAVAWSAVGCSPPPEPKEPRTTPSASTAEPAPAGSILRAELDVLLGKGPGELADLVPVEDATEGNKFVGWRILALPRGWDEGEIQAGDVVTSVNGMAIGRPEELFAVWRMLGVASEIKIAFLRDGQPGEVRLPIWGDSDPALVEALGSSAPAPPPDGAEPPPPPVRPREEVPKHKPTIVISPDDRPLSETKSWEQ